MFPNSEVFIVIEEKRLKENILVTANFNDAILTFMSKEYTLMEVWEDGKRKEVYESMDDIIKSGRVYASFE